MGVLIGVVAAVILGGGLATGAGYALTETNNPDTTAQVQTKLHQAHKYDPLLDPNDIYGQR